MKLNDFDYNLPEELIAQTPAKPRDSSRLLVLNHTNARNKNLDLSPGLENCHCEPLSRLKARQSTQKIALSEISHNEMKIDHRHFYNIIDYLKPGDVLVMNNSKVFPARLIGRKEITNGSVEILLNHEISDGMWECVGKNLKVGNRIKFDKSKLLAIVIEKNSDTYQIRFNMSGTRLFEEVEKIGLTPLPPYIKRNKKQETKYTKDDIENYQTVYAKEKGSVAAPTAGLHFTKELITKLKNKGVEIKYVTLHVGLGTFAQVKFETIKNYKIHKEYYSVDKKTLDDIVKAKAEHKRIIAVGTTTVRTLEAIFQGIQRPPHIAYESYVGARLNFFTESTQKKDNSKFVYSRDSYISSREAFNFSGWTDIFIYPGYKFICVDGIITNFHIPKSTLLMLVSAFAGKKNIDAAYAEAIAKKYRFYSFGDAMLIL